MRAALSLTLIVTLTSRRSSCDYSPFPLLVADCKRLKPPVPDVGSPAGGGAGGKDPRKLESPVPDKRTSKKLPHTSKGLLCAC